MEDWPIVAELLASHDDNLQKVESLAQREIFSIEAPVFNGLRDILPFSILTALRRMDYWFGKEPKIEHAICLAVVTDYISCSFNQRHFYRTFENALTAKFIDSLFSKLYEEWRRIFSGRPLIRFTDSELESIRKNLSRSVDRFPDSFRHKFLLNHIVELSDRYRKHISNENRGNLPIGITKTQHPLVSSENLLRKDKFKDESRNLMNSGLKRKSKPDITKYVVKKPMYNESTKNVPVHKQSTMNRPVVTKKPVTNSSAASHIENKAQVALEESTNKYNSDDDSMDSVDVYLTRRSLYSPTGGEKHHVPVSSPVLSFFEEMELLKDRPIEVIDSDEEFIKIKSDSTYSEISGDEKLSTNWNDTSDDENVKANGALDKNTNEVTMDENSRCSSSTLIDLEQFDVNCDSLPEYVPKEEKKISYDLQVINEKMNVANNNFSPTSAVRKDLVVPLCDCCPTTSSHTSGIPVPVVSAPVKKLNAFDILMRRVVPPQRKRFFK